MTATAPETAAWRLPALWRAAVGRCLYPCALALALALAMVAAEGLAEAAPRLPAFV